ncbi:MAG: protein kinase, partial [Gammaproteobacteria bacterium]|nr:protein kinase [Gammaproteobacteria bacterium]
MQIEPGQNLLHYTLSEKIGEGGMGVVWKAVDTTLDRDVAIKILPEAFAGDAERLARFEREAKLLASLNHPNIAGIYGIHEADGATFLSMELVDGEDLQQRLSRGALSRKEALNLALQIATAFEAAHETGVIHRDLKPANVKLTPDGKVKVLDFGLAKALSTDPSGPGTSPSMSPTLTSAGTIAGMILGTASYMSPEQAKGKEVDRRADIWSFGVVLYEMLTGRRLFEGEGISETLAAVIMKDVDWGGLPADTPQSIRRLLERCLHRDPKSRLRDIGDARVAIEEALSAAPESVMAAPAVRPRSGWQSYAPWGVA